VNWGRYLTVDELALIRRHKRLLRRWRRWRRAHETATRRKVTQVARVVVRTAVNHRRVNERRQRVQLFTLRHFVKEHRRRSTVVAANTTHRPTVTRRCNKATSFTFKDSVTVSETFSSKIENILSSPTLSKPRKLFTHKLIFWTNWGSDS